MTPSRNGTAVQIPVVDGFSRGPDGQRLSPFATFADRIMAGGSLDADIARVQPSRLMLPGGRIVVASPDRPPYVIEPDGSITQLVPHEDTP